MRSRGFTLIELIVTVIIMLLLASLLVAGYTGFNSSQAVTQAAETLKNDLRSIRTAAVSGNKPSECEADPADTLVGYRIDFPTDKTYTSVAVCLVTGDISGTEKTYELRPGVTFQGTPESFLFYPLNRGISKDQPQTITLTGATKTSSIQISANGEIGDAP